jgi:hypothetical protein
MKCLIIGSNFGLKGHLKAIKKIKLIPYSIASPNIFKKQLDIKIKRYKSAFKAINEFKYGILIISTKPKIQCEIIKYIVKNNYNNKFSGIMLEKPIANSFSETKKILNILDKKNILFNVNFIYTNLEIFKNFKKISNKIKINQITYDWKFKQAFFLNKKKTWKTKSDEGGGLINYYFIHLAYNLITIFERFRINKIEFDKNSEYLDKIKIYGKVNDIPIKINFDINSVKTIHCFTLENKRNVYKLINSSKDWTRNFKIFKNNLLMEKNDENRIDLTVKEYKKLKNKILNQSCNKELKKYELAHNICEKLNKLVKNNF